MIPRPMEDIWIFVDHYECHEKGSSWELEGVPFRVKNVEAMQDGLFAYDLRLSRRVLKNLDELEETIYNPKNRINSFYTKSSHLAYQKFPVLKNFAITPKFKGNIDDFMNSLECFPSNEVLKRFSNNRRSLMLAKYVELLTNAEMVYQENE